MSLNSRLDPSSKSEDLNRLTSSTQMSSKQVAYASLFIAFTIVLLGICVLIFERTKDVLPLLTLEAKPDPTFWDTLVANGILLAGVGVSSALAFLTYSVYRSAIEAIDLARIQTNIVKEQADAARHQAKAAIDQLSDNRIARRPFLKAALDEVRATTGGRSINSSCVVPIRLSNVGNGPAIDIQVSVKPLVWALVELPIYNGFSLPAKVAVSLDYTDFRRVNFASSLVPILEQGGSTVVDIPVSSDIFGLTNKHVAPEKLLDWLSSVNDAQSNANFGCEVTFRYRAIDIYTPDSSDGENGWSLFVVTFLLSSRPEHENIYADLHTVRISDPLLRVDYRTSGLPAFESADAVMAESVPLFAGIEEEKRVEFEVALQMNSSSCPPLQLGSSYKLNVWMSADSDKLLILAGANLRFIDTETCEHLETDVNSYSKRKRDWIAYKIGTNFLLDEVPIGIEDKIRQVEAARAFVDANELAYRSQLRGDDDENEVLA